MKKRWSLKGQNQGASLIAVLVALIFVGVISVIVLNVTMTNIQMREVEQSGKENFYDAEAVMDELTVGLNDIASAALEEAYTTILVDYRDIMVAGADIQSEFERLYMVELMDRLLDSGRGTKKNPETEPDGSLALTYEVGYYKEDVLKGCLSTTNQSYLAFDADAAKMSIDYSEGICTLEKVCVRYIDSQGYETSIQTDMVFYTPVLNFDGGNVVKEYMSYSLIADKGISANVMATVNGNVYAGVDGIVGENNGQLVINGDNIVTRGAIEACSGSKMVVGNGTGRIWAENVMTSGKGSASTLELRGNCYVADDLTLNGKNSTVTLYGNYYGYNFQENYAGDTVQPVMDSCLSSAMMINAQNAKLDMSNLDYLLVAGRTYISRGSKGNTQNQDIMLGESISVRTNQLAYYVPTNYVDATDVTNPVFTTTGEAEYSSSIGVSNLSSYLNTARPLTAYHFKDSGISATRYYLNFASEQAANDFYEEYYGSNSFRVNSFAENYAGNDAIILDDTTLYTFKGDVMYKGSAGTSYEEKFVTINGAEWEPGTTSDGIYWEFADRLAVNYKSLQMYLEDSHTSINSSSVRFGSFPAIDKSTTPLLSNIMDLDAIRAAYPIGSGTEIAVQIVKAITPISNQVVVIVNNEGNGAYDLGVDGDSEYYTEGIVIATGDVRVCRNFKGLIIAGGDISFASAGVEVTADGLMVAQMFKEDNVSATPFFSQYFTGYNTFSESVIGVVQIDEYLTYDNWTKNGE